MDGQNLFHMTALATAGGPTIFDGIIDSNKNSIAFDIFRDCNKNLIVFKRITGSNKNSKNVIVIC